MRLEYTTPARQMSFEQCLSYIEDDELVEVPPVSIRLRKRDLRHEERVVAKKRSIAAQHNE